MHRDQYRDTFTRRHQLSGMQDDKHTAGTWVRVDSAEFELFRQSYEAEPSPVSPVECSEADMVLSGVATEVARADQLQPVEQ